MRDGGSMFDVDLANIFPVKSKLYIANIRSAFRIPVLFGSFCQSVQQGKRLLQSENR